MVAAVASSGGGFFGWRGLSSNADVVGGVAVVAVAAVAEVGCGGFLGVVAMLLVVGLARWWVVGLARRWLLRVWLVAVGWLLVVVVASWVGVALPCPCALALAAALALTPAVLNGPQGGLELYWASLPAMPSCPTIEAANPMPQPLKSLIPIFPVLNWG